MFTTTRVATTILLALLLFSLSRCGSVGGQVFQVTKPTTDAVGASDFEFDDPNFQGHIVVTVRFNRAADPGSVVVGKTQLFDTPGDHNAGGTLQWNGDQEFKFTTTKNRTDLLKGGGGTDVGFTLTLTGTDKGSGVIKAKDGTVLDGDKDGTAGGDYKRFFLLPG